MGMLVSITRGSDLLPTDKERGDRMGMEHVDIAIVGTWDLFRYPGIRSDSDMFTLGYSFRPWTDAKAIADGGAIRQYISDTASEYRVDEEIRFNHRVLGAAW